MSSLDKIIKFTDLLQKFRTVERTIFIKESDRRENDSEHSFSLAMIAWYINDTYNLGLNMEKVLKYSLAHDLVEIYAGDTYLFDKDKSNANSKHEREELASKRLNEEFSEFPDVHNIIQQYESKGDRESRFIYALDKIEPMLNIYVDGGRTWRINEVSLDMLKEAKTSKVALDKDIEKIFIELIKKLESQEKELFN